MKMTLKSLSIENFKGIKELNIDFSEGTTTIYGRNASGKTTVMDAVCWLLFGKDSFDREKFEIRPLDENGEKVHNVEISVEAVVDVDGKEMTLLKIQKENWVKARGQEKQELKGNVNEMQINGFPKSDKDFKEKISRIVSEDMFKILTNPTHFPSLAWKEQRNILMRFVGDNADVELAKEFGGYDDLLSDLEYAKDTDEIAKKYGKQIKDLRQTAEEIPVRIDEIDKSRVYIDTDALENKKKGIETQIENINKQIASGKVDISDLENELSKIDREIAECKAKADEVLREKRSSLKDSLADAERELKDKKFEKSKYTDENIEAKRRITEGKAKIEELRSEYMQEKERKMSANATVCPACGREFEQDKVEEITKHFTEERAKKLKMIDTSASEIDQSNKDLGKIVEQTDEKVGIIEKEIATIEGLVESINAELSNLPEIPDYEDDDKYTELMHRKDVIEVEMAERMANSTDTSALEVKRDELKTEMADIDRDIASAKHNEDIDTRIAELEKKQKDTQQKIADAERLLFMLEKFVKAKMENISKTINEQFEMCDFKLFETQINGGIKECCELTFNGVPYSTLNSGHRIVCGIDIIKSLQRLLGTKVPIWVDNSETVNEFNMPSIEDTQMVLLKVTEDEKLRFM